MGAAIVDLDADVVSMEASRSQMELLDDFASRGYPNEIGPGIWDIHSPRVPGDAELDDLLARAAEAFGADRLWVNPDCGLNKLADGSPPVSLLHDRCPPDRRTMDTARLFSASLADHVTTT